MAYRQKNMPRIAGHLIDAPTLIGFELKSHLRAAFPLGNQLAGCGEPALRTNLSAFRRT